MGAYIRENVKKSRRFGIELTNVFNTKDFYINSSLSLSRNLVYNFNEILYDYGPDFTDYNTVENIYKTTDLAFSPNIIWAAQADYKLNSRTSVIFNSKYVGEQYIDNTSSKERMIDDYLVSNLQIDYNLSSRLFKNAKISFLINNLFDIEYVSNAWTVSYTHLTLPTNREV